MSLPERSAPVAQLEPRPDPVPGGVRHSGAGEGGSRDDGRHDPRQGGRSGPEGRSREPNRSVSCPAPVPRAGASGGPRGRGDMARVRKARVGNGAVQFLKQGGDTRALMQATERCEPSHRTHRSARKHPLFSLSFFDFFFLQVCKASEANRSGRNLKNWMDTFYSVLRFFFSLLAKGAFNAPLIVLSHTVLTIFGIVSTHFPS